ncbi:MAG TPA: tannase/feruloyl esterase family alpha/beta hydrolase, partial [Burkholderiaceae bacterium]
MPTTPRYRCIAAARTATGLAALLAACALAGPAQADDKHNHGRPTCGDLTGRRIADAQIVSADLVAATTTLPEYCRVHGLIEPKLNFELRLPTDWNSKLHYGGGGGYNGTIPP